MTTNSATEAARLAAFNERVFTEAEALAAYGAQPEELRGDWVEAHMDDLYEIYWQKMPYGTAKARTGDPSEWIGERLEADYMK